MKKYILVIIFFFITSFEVEDSLEIRIFNEPEEINIEEIEPIIPPPGLNDFLYKLAHRESSGDHTAINPYGYLGKYQFSYNLIKRLGFNISKSEFLNNPKLQDEVMKTLLTHNIDILKKHIQLYDGTFSQNDSLITKSGILAAAHLIGPRRTKLYLEHGIVSQDGNGTLVTEYIYEFSGYTINL